MKLKKVISYFFNPYIGPILVISILFSILFFVILPRYSYENKTNQMTQRAVETLNNLKKIRIYYTSNVVEKLKNVKQVKIDYSHKKNYLTIPLAVTMIHDLSKLLPEDDMEIKIYSNYPFKNRKNRVLSDYEKDSLAYLVKNPEEIYARKVIENNKKVYKVAIADVMWDSTCVECHNIREDSPKKDWEIGDVRGAIEISIPFEDELVLTSNQITILSFLFILAIIILGTHYTSISISRQKEHNRIKIELEEEVLERTASLNNTVKLLNEYKKAVDFSAIVSKTNKKGIITYVNEEFTKISKYSKEELIGKSHNIVRHEDMPNSVYEELWKTINAKKIWKGRIKNRAKDGTSYYVASTIVPIVNYKDEIEEFLAIRLDITDIVESQLKAQKADKSKSTFLANMSHEIRTPLNAIIGFSQVLTKSSTLNTNEKKQANIIQTSANSLLSIINDILDISKIDSGNFEILIEDCDIKEVSSNVIELFSSKADEKNIKLEFNFDKDIPSCIKTDGVRVRQVISNFISNAIKFTENEGRVGLDISLKEKIDNNKALINFEIEDTGIGIPKEKLESIFNPFIQIDNKSNRKFQGTGLGLSICKYIIESLGSSVLVQSTENVGTKFSFLLEVEICEKSFNKQNIEKKQIQEISSSDQAQAFEGKVLVAEDNSANQELISYILNDMQLDFKIVSNGEEAKNFVKNENFDLILMDINMPVMDGTEAFLRIREYERDNQLKNIPIIALTANAIKGDKEKFLSLGMDGYLSKPINTWELKKIFKKYLKEKLIETKDKIDSKEHNISLISKKLGISEGISKQILKKFEDDILEDLEELKNFIDKDDKENMSEKAHYIKNSCLNVCLEEACEYLQKIENQDLTIDENKQIFEKIRTQIISIL